MLWIVFERIGVFVVTAYTGKQLFDSFLGRIKPGRVYSAEQVADILKVEKADIVQIIHKRELKARKIKKKYYILGENLINYLTSTTHK